MSEFPDDFRIPFMTLHGLAGEEIRGKLNEKRVELEQLIKKLRSEKVGGNTEQMKIARLQLMWVIYAQSWAKLKYPREDELLAAAERAEQSEEEDEMVD